jgi:hypothetical protein
MTAGESQTLAAYVDASVAVSTIDGSIFEADSVRGTPTQSVAVGEAPSVIALLQARVVNEQRYAGRVLYSWTTVEQVQELRAAGRVLLRTAHDTPRGQLPSPFNRWLFARQNGSSITAHVAQLLLRDEVLMRRRYAWTSPYATVLGLGPRSYGTALIRLTLRPDALWLMLDPSRVGSEFSAVDSDNRPVELSQVLSHPRQIAVVYHVRDREAPRAAFREYVLCNEAMIASWSVGTPEIAAEIADERALLQQLAGPLGAERFSPAQLALGWRAPQSEQPLAQEQRLGVLYSATLAFAVPAYQGSRVSVERMRNALAQYDPTAPPLEQARSIDQLTAP